MSPEYLEELADLADPDQLWRQSAVSRMDLPADKRHQLDMGIALRRHASHVRTLRRLLEEKRSLLITPISPNGSATRSVDTPDYHQRLRPNDTSMEVE